MAESAVAAVKLIPYTDARGVKRWVEVEASAAASLEAYDRWARRRDSVFRARHVTATDRAARPETRPRKERAARRVAGRFELVGYLNFELEPATPAARREGGEPWEGPKFLFEHLIGEGPVWDGPAARFTHRERGADAVYGLEVSKNGRCSACGGERELPEIAACLRCCRTGRDREIPRGQPKAKAPAPKPAGGGLRGGMVGKK